MPSKIEIVNQGLILLGHRSINSLTQENETARKVNILYDSSLEAALRSAEWKFAGRIKVLALLSNEEIPGFLYAYARPPKALFIRRIFAEGAPDKERKNKHDEMQAPTSGQAAIFTDVQYAYAEYTENITDTTKFDSLFSRAFAAKLAADLALAITGDKQLAQLKAQLYFGIVSEAKAASLNESRNPTKSSSRFLDARG